ncbi:MAG: hypothetical protein HY820_04200 [Acidobacteria bacterium]|nr:hypothetical protein [Acidobacteriota bacterium]
MYPKSRELAREGAATLEFLLNGRTVIAETVEAHETLLDYLVPNCAAMPGLFRGRLGRLAHVAV